MEFTPLRLVYKPLLSPKGRPDPQAILRVFPVEKSTSFVNAISPCGAALAGYYSSNMFQRQNGMIELDAGQVLEVSTATFLLSAYFVQNSLPYLQSEMRPNDWANEKVSDDEGRSQGPPSAGPP